MRPDFAIASIAAVIVAFIATVEVFYISGPFSTVIAAACIVSMFLFSVSRSPKGRAMTAQGGEVEEGYEYGGGSGVERRLSRLTEDEKREIVQAVFDKIYVEVGRNVVKKAILVILSAALVLIVYLTKNHVEIR